MLLVSFRDSPPHTRSVLTLAHFFFNFTSLQVEKKPHLIDFDERQTIRHTQKHCSYFSVAVVCGNEVFVWWHPCHQHYHCTTARYWEEELRRTYDKRQKGKRYTIYIQHTTNGGEATLSGAAPHSQKKAFAGWQIRRCRLHGVVRLMLFLFTFTAIEWTLASVILLSARYWAPGAHIWLLCVNILAILIMDFLT